MALTEEEIKVTLDAWREGRTTVDGAWMNWYGLGDRRDKG